MNSPAISVIMPVFNSQRYLAEAIESILDQTFTDFEFLIFDDGSTDRSPAIIREYADKDARIVAEFSAANKGYVVHLNQGIRRARGRFIARMDSDDVSMSHRLEKQVQYLKDHPAVGIVGSSAIIIDHEAKQLRINRRESDPLLIKWTTFFTNPFYHSSLLIRKSLFDRVGFYDAGMQPAEDRDMWLRAFYETEFGNIVEPLIKYRVHEKSISITGQERQVKNSEQCLNAHYKRYLNIELEPGNLPFFREFHKRDVDISRMDSTAMANALIRLQKKFREDNRERLSNEALERIRHDVFVRLLYIAVKGMKTPNMHSAFLFARLLTNYPFLFFRFLARKVLP